MKQLIKWQLVTILMLSASVACAGNVDVNINLGGQPRQVIVREPQVNEDVQFIYPNQLGFYVAAGLPYDLFFVQNNYYLYRDGRWSRSSHSQGPWVYVDRRALPPGLRKHKMERIHHYRDQEYGVYRQAPERYRGKHFRSPREEWKEQRKDGKELRKEMKRDEKEDRKDAKRAEKEDRKAAKREEKEDRKSHKKDK
jgi:WXXGXW repeat (2 copies)